MSVLHLLAGPNGAGKSVLFRSLVAPRYPALPFAVNDAERSSRLEQDESFVTATAFSHPSKVELLTRARARGFEIVLYIVCVDSPSVLLKRIGQRVERGGHDVPAHTVVARYARMLGLLDAAVALADLSLFIDGGDVRDGGPRLIASVAAQRLYLHEPLRPRWVEKVLGFAER